MSKKASSKKPVAPDAPDAPVAPVAPVKSYHRVCRTDDTTRLTFSDSTLVILDRKQIDGRKVTSHQDCKDNGYHMVNGVKMFSVVAPDGKITSDVGCTTVCKRLGWVENHSKPAHTAKWLNANGYTTLSGRKFGGRG